MLLYLHVWPFVIKANIYMVKKYKSLIEKEKNGQI